MRTPPLASTRSLPLILGSTLAIVLATEAPGWCQSQGMANDLDQPLPMTNGRLVKIAYGEQGAIVLAATERKAGSPDTLHVFGSAGPGQPWIRLVRTSLMEEITGLDVVVAQGYSHHVVADVAHVVMTMDHVERFCDKNNVCSDGLVYSYAAVLSGPPLARWTGGGHLTYADLPNEPWPRPVTVAAALANRDYNGDVPQEYDLSVAIGTFDWVKETHLSNSGLNIATFSPPKDLPLELPADRLLALSSFRLRGVVFAAISERQETATLVHSWTDSGSYQFSRVSWIDSNQVVDLLDCSKCAMALHDNLITVLRRVSNTWEARTLVPGTPSPLGFRQVPGSFSSVAQSAPLLLTNEGWTGVVFTVLEDVNKGVEVYGLRQMEWPTLPSGIEPRVRVEDVASGQPGSVALAGRRGQNHGTIAWLGKNRDLLVDP